MTARLAVVVLVVLAAPAAVAVPVEPSSARPGDVLVVDDDGGADYATVRAAVGAAGPGDTVRVRPGTYRERVTVDAAVTLVAPRGATLDGSEFADDGAGIEIGAAAVVDGFTVSGYAVGVDAAGTTSDWVLANSTVRNASFIAVDAGGTAGDWHVRDVTVRNTSTGIHAVSSTGDWTVTDTVVRNATEGDGVDAASSAGAWVLRNVTVADVDFVGVAASHTSGDWRIVNATVRDTTVGVSAYDASGDWVIRGSTIANASAETPYEFWQPPLEEGVGIDASETDGSWSVHGTRLVDNDAGGIVASGAAPTGDATRNWWGDGADCTGNVDCGDPLTEWPPGSPGATPSPTADGPRPTGSPTPAPGTSPTPTLASGPATPTATPGTVPLSPTVAVAGLLAAAVLVGRRHE